MTELESVIDKLVRSVKQKGTFENIRFINAYNLQPAEKPVEGFLAVLETGEIGDVIKLNTRLIGGSDISGSQLGYTAVELAAALKEADTDTYIDSIVLSETKYDKNITAFYRDIKLSLLLGAGGFKHDSYTSILINSEPVSGITAFKWEEIIDGVSLYEFNRGEPYANINSKKYYEITVETKEVSLLNFENGFTLATGKGEKAISFFDCMINKISTSLNTKGQIIYKVTIISDKKVTA